MDLYQENCDLEKKIKAQYKKNDNEARGRSIIIDARQKIEYDIGKIVNENYFEWQTKYNAELRKILAG